MCVCGKGRELKTKTVSILFSAHQGATECVREIDSTPLPP